MEHDPGPLPDDLATAHQLIRELAQTVRDQEQFIAKLQHQLEQLLRPRQGRKAEAIDPHQLWLCAQELLAAAPAEPPPSPPPAAVPATMPEGDPPPKRSGHGRKPLPAGLPRRCVLHDVPPEQLPCPECGTVRTRIGEEIRAQLHYVPASMIVLRHVRPQYACTACQAQVTSAERLPEPIEKGLPGPGLLAQVITRQSADHLPLYRQEGIFRRFGVELPRQTTCDWMRVAAELLEPIWKEMLRRIKLSAVIQTDDTPVRVLDPDHGGSRQGRLCDSVGDRDHPYIVFDSTPDHTSDGPERILRGDRGDLPADAYSAYDGLYASGALVAVGCWMPARRKFSEARTSDPERAHQALARISLLYEVEREAKGQGLDDAERQALRAARSRPILAALRTWLEAARARVLPQSPLGEAIGSAWNQWAALNRDLEAGFLEIDTGASERGLRPVALGRSNWLFFGSDRGGRTAAILISLCATSKRLGVDVLASLTDVLERISTHPNSRLGELLPDRWQAIRAGPS